MMQREATVISCNKFTHDIVNLAQRADILIAAVGVPGLITKDHVKPGAIVIDVGVSRITDPRTGKSKTVGDVAFDEVAAKTSHISPVPGGVGPVTVSMLLRNTVAAVERRL
jgi:5,10-methylene-tetrahydrofolate dehydrogenase/methenyl tetrahydrofolate cyclohydrolase